MKKLGAIFVGTSSLMVVWTVLLVFVEQTSHVSALTTYSWRNREPDSMFRYRSRSEIVCDNGRRIPGSYRCDGDNDCGDGTDERNCDKKDPSGRTICGPAERGLRCEQECVKHNETYSACACRSGYKLVNGTDCEDIDECAVGSDQQTNQTTLNNSTSALYHHGPCSQKCNNFEGTFTCDCVSGYELVNRTECRVKGNETTMLYYAIGNQLRGYDVALKTMFPVVEAVEGQVITAVVRMHKKVFYAVQQKDGGGSLKTQSMVYKILLDDQNQRVLPHHHPELIYRNPSGKIKGIALDPLENLFIAEERRILLCHADLLYCRTVRSSLSSGVTGLTSAMISGQSVLYFSQHSSAIDQFHALSRIMFDGDRPQEANFGEKVDLRDLSNDATRSRIVGVNPIKQEIQFIDSKKNSTQNLTSVTLYKATGYTPRSPVLFEDTLFWINPLNNSILSCDIKQNCSKIETFVQHKSVSSSPINEDYHSLAVYHPVMRRHSAFADHYLRCAFRTPSCSHFCLPTAPIIGAYFYITDERNACSCPDQMTLDPQNNSTCRNRPDRQFLIVNTGFKVFKYYHQEPTPNWEVLLRQDEPTDFLFEVQLAYNPNRSELYVYEGKALMALTGTEDSGVGWRILVKKHIGAIRALVYDLNTDLLYWVDELRGSLEACSTSGPKLRAVLRRDLVKPISLALHAQTKTWFVGLRSEPNQIISLDMDGQNRKIIFQSLTGLPLDLLVMDGPSPGGQQLVWADPQAKTLNSYTISKASNAILPQSKTIWAMKSNKIATVDSLAALNHTLYWTNAQSLGFYFTELSDTVNLTKWNAQIQMQPELLDHAVDGRIFQIANGNQQPQLYNNCQNGSHSCAHLCLLSTARKYSCACAEGFILQKNGLDCAANLTYNASVYQPLYAEFHDQLERLDQTLDQSSSSWFFYDENQTKESTQKTTDSSSVESVSSESKASEETMTVVASKTSASGIFWLVFLTLLVVILAVGAYVLFSRRTNAQYGFSTVFQRAQSEFVRLRADGGSINQNRESQSDELPDPYNPNHLEFPHNSSSSSSTRRSPMELINLEGINEEEEDKLIH